MSSARVVGNASSLLIAGAAAAWRIGMLRRAEGFKAVYDRRDLSAEIRDVMLYLK
jgi:hypothetical protein